MSCHMSHVTSCHIIRAPETFRRAGGEGQQSKHACPKQKRQTDRSIVRSLFATLADGLCAPYLPDELFRDCTVTVSSPMNDEQNESIVSFVLVFLFFALVENRGGVGDGFCVSPISSAKVFSPRVSPRVSPRAMMSSPMPPPGSSSSPSSYSQRGFYVGGGRLEGSDWWKVRFFFAVTGEERRCEERRREANHC